jgi:hypothetical protein
MNGCLADQGKSTGMGIRDSIWSVLGRDTSDATDLVLERVRNAMLMALEEYGDGTQVRLDMKISSAREISALWYLRPEIMQLVASARGEVVARTCVARITALFGKYQMGGKTSRFGGL